MNISLQKQELDIFSVYNLQVVDQDLSESFSDFFQKLNQLDLQPVAQKLMSSNNENGWTAEEAELAISFYKMFLCLHFLFPDIALIPTKTIDTVWHTHILLNTAKYIQDCQNLYGYILHHYSPNDENLEFNQQDQETSCAVTKALFEKFLGVGVLGNNVSQLAYWLIFSWYSHQSQKSACLTIPRKG